MSKILIKRQHTLSEEECHKLTLSIVEQWQKQLGGDVQVDGSTIRYRHPVSGTNGTVESTDDELIVNVKLGFVMNFMKPKIEQEINRLCDEAFVDNT